MKMVSVARIIVHKLFTIHAFLIFLFKNHFSPNVIFWLLRHYSRSIVYLSCYSRYQFSINIEIPSHSWIIKLRLFLGTLILSSWTRHWLWKSFELSQSYQSQWITNVAKHVSRMWKIGDFAHSALKLKQIGSINLLARKNLFETW